MTRLDSTDIGVRAEQLEVHEFVEYGEMMKIMHTVDFIVVPLADTEFNNCKSEIKIFEAASLGKPVIASPTSPYLSYIQHGHNGLLAKTPKDWEEFILRMIDDHAYRCRISANSSLLVNRFTPESVAAEYRAFFSSVSNGESFLAFKRLAKTHPQLSIISVLYRKQDSIHLFLDSIRLQTYPGTIEVILIDDCSPMNDAEIAETYRDLYASESSRVEIRIIKSTENTGNCTSRNLGLQFALGEYITIIDADCLPNQKFAEEVIRTFNETNCDVVIGPMNIETNQEHPYSCLNRYSVSRQARIDDSNLQNPSNNQSFVNLITRNFTIRRSFLDESLGSTKLFDPQFNYSENPESGFGWEDVEMGYRVWKNNAKIIYNTNIVTVHCSHPDSCSQDKPLKSLKNFSRLISKHPEIPSLEPSWFQQTFLAILQWCGLDPTDLDTIPAVKQILNIAPLERNSRIYLKPSRRFKILTYRWHVPHQYELYKSGHSFTLVTGLGSSMCEQWEYGHRPLPPNAEFKHASQINVNDFDLAILHFDENVMDNEPVLPSDWGTSFHNALRTWTIPKIAVCHGTPQFHGQYTDGEAVKNWGEVIEKNRLDIVEYLKDIHVVCNSYQAQREWGFHKSSVIWHGFSPSEYVPARKYGSRILTMRESAMKGRIYYNGYNVFRKVSELLAQRDIQIETFDLSPSPESRYSNDPNMVGANRFYDYARQLSSYSIYLNPTIRSPMPRSRGEAMISGLATVNYDSHDVSLFIRNGINGFYSKSAEELADFLAYLYMKPCELKKIALESRLTALALFSIDRYLADWNELITSMI